MGEIIERLLNGREENHVLPFFWQHGESEETLRKMMGVISGANCHEVCIESRPHPDFLGPSWWKTMDIILDEAKKRNMRVWILDDSHFPTGYANGALQNADERLCRENIFPNTMMITGPEREMTIDLRAEGMFAAPKMHCDNPALEQYLGSIKPARVFDDDRILAILCRDAQGRTTDLKTFVHGECLTFTKPAGDCTLSVLVASRNSGYHRNYINMLDRDSVRVLIDTVYEPHYTHYREYFGNTIAGFFSDEPELGNGFMYAKGNTLGTMQDLPWSRALEEEMRKALGDSFAVQLFALWNNDKDKKTARIHTLYMDALTRLVRSCFSEQIGSWCRERGVLYIGHMIEDDGQHCRTGSSLGHYFRGLQGQDMAGIDDIGGQVLPQGEDGPSSTGLMKRDGTFYHYGLGKLAASAAALEQAKQGRSMCEIFGNYGWEEGVQLEKYMADHFLVRGINHFVPHAFTGKDFPDPDCPPHFYAQGHNPQYRHFGALMQYMNRVATLTESGTEKAEAAILYHGEAEWCDDHAQPFEVPLRVLYDQQIDSMVLPSDAFSEKERYGTWLEKKENNEPLLHVGSCAFRVLVVPQASFLPDAAAESIETLLASDFPVLFVDRLPKALCSGKDLPEEIRSCSVVSLADLPGAVQRAGVRTPEVVPANDRIRILEEEDFAMIVNEGKEAWKGTITFRGHQEGYWYDAWRNVCEKAICEKAQDGLRVEALVEPLKSRIFLFEEANDLPELLEERTTGEEIPMGEFTRSICEGTEYPSFAKKKKVCLPDHLAEEEPAFSGFVRYETDFTLDQAVSVLLVISDAKEGVEVFLNGKSLGLQIAAPYRYLLPAKEGNNHLVIEVATTLERECYPLLTGYQKMLAKPPVCGSGITGEVHLYRI